MAKPKVTISIVSSEHDCDDCGIYINSDASVLVNGREVVRACHDGHLGGGNWDGKTKVLLYWTLQALGLTVLVNAEKPDWAMPYGEIHYCAVPREWEEVSLLPADGSKSRVLDLDVEVDDEGYPLRSAFGPIGDMSEPFLHVNYLDEEGFALPDNKCAVEAAMQAALQAVAIVDWEELHEF